MTNHVSFNYYSALTSDALLLPDMTSVLHDHAPRTLLSTIFNTLSLMTPTLAPSVNTTNAANTHATAPLNPAETEQTFSTNYTLQSTQCPSESELYEVEIDSYSNAAAEEHRKLLSRSFEHTQMTGSITAVYSVDGKSVTVNTSYVSPNPLWDGTKVQTVELDREKEFQQLYGDFRIREEQYDDDVGNGDEVETIVVYGSMGNSNSNRTRSTRNKRAQRSDSFRDLDRIKGPGDSD